MSTTPKRASSRLPRFALYDRVMTKGTGSVGTVIDIYAPNEYDVEFDEPSYPGEPVSIELMHAANLLPYDPEVKHFGNWGQQKQHPTPPLPGGEVPWPTLAQAIFSDDKLHYFFGEHEKGGDKGRILTAALGFTKESSEEFRRRLLAAVAAAAKAHLGGFDRRGERLWLDTTIEGLNGRTMVVRSAWRVREPGGAPQLSTVEPDRNTPYLPRFALYDRVITRSTGRVGTIVEVWEVNDYEVEFDEPAYPWEEMPLEAVHAINLLPYEPPEIPQKE